MGELVSDGENGLLVPPGDAEALSIAIEKAVSDEWNPLFSANARKRYLERYGPDRHVEALLGIMRTVTEGSVSPRP